MVKLRGLFEQEKLNKKEVGFLHVSIKKEKIPLGFFPFNYFSEQAWSGHRD